MITRTSQSLSLHVTADVTRLAEIRRFVEETAAALGVEAGLVPKLQLAVDEAATNIIVHGYQGQVGLIEIEMQRDGTELVIRLRDSASPFDPTTVPPPDLTLQLEERPPGGLGIHLMRQAVDRLSYSPLPQGGNELSLIKTLA
ncbi:MAG: ATP-binding protein [Thermoflexales bacterium]|nr:ATP-binding protein [Thermoflexales bacterium]